MSLIFYHSIYCPRCNQVKKHLAELLGDQYSTQIVSIDSLKHPVKTWCDGIHMIPALKHHNDILSGVFLSKMEIENFLEKHGLLFKSRGDKE